MKNENVLIIDCQGLGYAAYHSLGELSAREVKTGIIFGFLKQVLSLAKKFDTNRFIFCWDSRKNKRKKIYPEYKYKRNNEMTKEELKAKKIIRQQFVVLRKEVLPALGFKNIFIKPGYEADDLIANLVHNGAYPKDWWACKKIVVSADNDMWQLLNLCDVYSVQAKKRYTAKSFKEEWGIECHMWGKVKTVAGCSGDEVPGVEGVGNKKAIAFLNGKLPDGIILKRLRSAESKAIFERNKKLVVLPMKRFQKLKVSDDEVFYKDVFIDVFEQYIFKTFLKKEAFKMWERVFNLKSRRK